MLVYLITLFVVVLSAFLAEKSKSVFVSRCLLGIAFVTMVFVAGLRDKSVGTDAGYYVRDFNKIQKFADVVDITSKRQEYGFWILIWLVHLASNEYMFFFLAIALIVVACYQRVIVAHSANIGVSFFIFIAMFYTFFFNAARQGIACAIFALAIGPLLKGNFRKYVGYVLLACLFHNTAIVMLPVYFLVNRACTFKNSLIIVLVACFMLFFADKIIAFAATYQPRYAEYGEKGMGGGYLSVSFTVANFIFLYLFKKSISIERKQYDLFLNMLLIEVLIGMGAAFMGTDPSGLLRVCVYLDFANILIWAIVFKNLTTPLSKFVVGYSFFLVHFTYFVLATNRFSNLVPYSFNPFILLS